MPYSDGTFPSGAGTVMINAATYKCNSFTVNKASQTYNAVSALSAPSGSLSYGVPLTGTAELQFSASNVAEPTTVADNYITGIMIANVAGSYAALMITSCAITKPKNAPWTANISWQKTENTASPSGLPWTGTNYLYGQNGTTSTVSTPDSSYTNNITGFFSAEICCKPASTTSGITGLFYAGGASPKVSVNVYLNSGYLSLDFSKNGTTIFGGGGSASAVTALTNQTVYYRIARDPGVSSGTYYFAESLDGVTWTDLGGTTGDAGLAFNTTGPLVAGAYPGSPANACEGVTRFRVWNGYNAWTSTPMFDLNPQLYAGGTTYTAANSTAAEIWTLNGSAIIVSLYS